MTTTPTAKVTPRNLKVGDKLLVELDVNGVYTGEWVEAKVMFISVCHNYRSVGVLDPYIAVQLDHPRLHIINYGEYCRTSHVKRIAP